LKKVAITLAAVIALTAAVAIIRQPAKQEISELDRILIGFEAAVRELGHEFAYMEKLTPEVIYTDGAGGRIVYNRYLCSDPEQIESGNVFFYAEVFDPTTADSVQAALVNGKKALLCEKESRAYLLWYPNEYTILMLDYDPYTVFGEDIIKMAESCG